jgi:Ca2+-binding EF-hand superfamily protein
VASFLFLKGIEKEMAAKQEVAGKFVLNPQDILAFSGSFAVADKNKDGSLDFAEFVQLFSTKGITVCSHLLRNIP